MQFRSRNGALPSSPCTVHTVCIRPARSVSSRYASGRGVPLPSSSSSVVTARRRRYWARCAWSEKGSHHRRCGTRTRTSGSSAPAAKWTPTAPPGATVRGWARAPTEAGWSSSSGKDDALQTTKSGSTSTRLASSVPGHGRTVTRTALPAPAGPGIVTGEKPWVETLRGSDHSPLPPARRKRTDACESAPSRGSSTARADDEGGRSTCASTSRSSPERFSYSSAHATVSASGSLERV